MPLKMPPVAGAGQNDQARGVMLVDDDGLQYSLAVERRLNGFICWSKKNISTTGYGLLIDLSDTVNYPHNYTERIDISTLFIGIDKDMAARGQIGVGVITRIDNTDADVTYFQGYTFQLDDTRVTYRDRTYSPSFLKAGVDMSGNTPFIVSNEKETNVTALNLLTPLADTTAGISAAPGVGDIIVKYETTAGDYNLSVSSHYQSQDDVAAL